MHSLNLTVLINIVIDSCFSSSSFLNSSRTCRRSCLSLVTGLVILMVHHLLPHSEHFCTSSNVQTCVPWKWLPIKNVYFAYFHFFPIAKKRKPETAYSDSAYIGVLAHVKKKHWINVGIKRFTLQRFLNWRYLPISSDRLITTRISWLNVVKTLALYRPCRDIWPDSPGDVVSTWLCTAQTKHNRQSFG